MKERIIKASIFVSKVIAGTALFFAFNASFYLAFA